MEKLVYLQDRVISNMKNLVYLQDRGGKVHVWNGSSPSKKDPWQRAVCGDPGDFNELINYGGVVTCQSCKRALCMLTQIPLSGENLKLK
jgi:hypothetical protein